MQLEPYVDYENWEINDVPMNIALNLSTAAALSPGRNSNGKLQLQQ